MQSYSGNSYIKPNGYDSNMNMKMNMKQEKSLAMAYVPFQKFEDLYDLNMALIRGTIFKQLDKPFLGYGGMR